MGTAVVTQDAPSGANNVAGGSTTPAKQELGRQSVSIPGVHNLDGIKKLFAFTETSADGKSVKGELNEDALVRFVNMGLRQGLNNAVRREITAKDKDGNPTFQFVDGVYDATPLIQKEPERQRRTFLEKLEKQLKDAGQPQKVIELMLKTYTDNVGAEQTSDITGDVVEVVLTKEGTGDAAKLVMKSASREEEE